MKNFDMIIVGLGNPGYDKTRHNVGFDVVDKIAQDLSAQWKKSKFQADIAEVRIDIKNIDCEKNDRLKIVNDLCNTRQINLKYGDSHAIKLYLLKPTTYMNDSGIAVGQFVRYLKLNKSDVSGGNLLVFHDELDKKLGLINFATKKSSHNGLRSIAEHINSEEYWKCGIGIDRPENKEDVSRYVLSEFSHDERKVIDEVVDNIKINLINIISIAKA